MPTAAADANSVRSRLATQIPYGRRTVNRARQEPIAQATFPNTGAVLCLFARRVGLEQLLGLEECERVSVWVLEPGRLAYAWGRGDMFDGLERWEVVVLEDSAAVLQFPNIVLDVVGPEPHLRV